MNYLQLFKEGREEGFNYFFREYYVVLTYHAFDIVKDRSTAEEIAGDAFIKLWERHANFSTIPAIRSFLYTTTYNASLNCLRQQKKTAQRLKEIAYFSEHTELSRFQAIVEAETYREIFIAIKLLPPQCRKIFQMLFIEGKELKQVAAELKLSPSTVSNQKARGLMLIRQKIGLATLLFIYFTFSF